jgi:ribosomal protein S18 acetylase RimI-like enzyme
MRGVCTTEHVWQIAQRDGEEQIAVTISDVRLPRPMVVEYPRTAQLIQEVWQSSDALLVAEEEGQICGFLDLRAEGWRRLASARNLIVAEPYRRRGVGSALLAAANRWTRGHDLEALMVEAQSQSWPAVRFYRKLGFAFCGFNERYYVNKIALFFTRRVK